MKYIGVIPTCFILKADTHPELLLLGFGIAEQCTRQEKILKLIASGSIEVEGRLLDLSMLYDLMGPQQPMADSPQQPFASYSKWCFRDAESQQSLIYPTREFYFNEPLLDLVGDRSSCRENTYYPDGQLQYNCTGPEMTDMLSVFSDLYFSKSTNKSSKLTMLVPYFERYHLPFFLWLLNVVHEIVYTCSMTLLKFELNVSWVKGSCDIVVSDSYYYWVCRAP